MDKVVVTAISSDGIGFQFRYSGKLYKCSYEYAIGRLFKSPYYVPEYRNYLRQLNEERAQKAAKEQLRIEASARQSRNEADYRNKLSNTTVEASCDNCFFNRNDSCHVVKKQLCSDYRPGNIRSSNEINPPRGYPSSNWI